MGPPISRSHWLLMQAATCLSHAAIPSRRDEALQAAARCTHALAELGMPYAAGNVELYRAALAFQEGGKDEAVDRLRSAARVFDAPEGNPVNAAVARRRLGQLVGGDEGRSLVAGADAAMAAEGIVRPERCATTAAPGFSVAPSMPDE